LLILVICILIYIVVVSKTKLKPMIYKDVDIPKFTTNISYDPYPETVEIENRHDCNIEHLHVCDMNDPTTLFGCKELVVRCHHFDKDIEYIQNRETTTIPKNSSPNEGYALAITSIADSCNANHGDLILVTTDPTTNEYAMLCNCKNPGYIGNDHILGNCTTVYICNGKIDDINQPLANINCECDMGSKSMRYDDGLPVCREMTIKEANEKYDDWTSLVTFNSDRQLDIQNFNATVRGNLKIKKLLNPCTNSIHDTTIAIDSAEFNNINNECRLTDYGYPISTGMLEYKPTNTDETASIDGVLATGKYLRVRFSDNINRIRRLYGLVVKGLKFHDEFKDTEIALVPRAGLTLGTKGSFLIKPNENQFVAPSCEGNWPKYSCYLNEYYKYMELGLMFPGSRDCPSSFLWDREFWDTCEFLVRTSVRTEGRGLVLNNEKFQKLHQIRPYGLQWSSQSTIPSGVLSFVSSDDYNIHKNTIT